MAEQRVRVVHQVAVERVVAGDEHRRGGAPGAARPARLLPERGPGPRPARDQHRVEAADVDAELERGGRGHAGDPPVPQPRLEAPAVVGQVARPVGGHRAGRIAVERVAGGQRDGLGAAPRPEEGERGNLRPDQGGQQVRGLGGGGPARSRLGVRVQQGRLPERERERRPGRAVIGHRGRGQAGELPGAADRVGDRGRGEDEDGLLAAAGGGVVGRDAAEPAQHLGDVRAEDAAIAVALVDDHDPQTAEKAAPAMVVRQQPAVDHVGVCQQIVGVRLRPGALRDRGVPVVAGGADAGHPEVADGLQLIGGERLGRRDVEHGAAVEHLRQRRRQVAGRLAGGGASSEDHTPPGPREPRRLCLVGPGGRDATGRERGGHLGSNRFRPGGGSPRFAGYVG